MKRKTIIANFVFLLILITSVSSQKMNVRFQKDHADISVFEYNPENYEKFYTGATSINPEFTIKFYDDNFNEVYSKEAYYDLNNIFNYNENITFFSIYYGTYLFYESSLDFCNNNGVCEYCKDCPLNENALTCSDCEKYSRDGLCEVGFGVCDPDCRSKCDLPDIIENVEQVETCKNSGGTSCKKDETCVGSLYYTSDDGSCCSGECKTEEKLADERDLKKPLLKGVIFFSIALVLAILIFNYLKKKNIIVISVIFVVFALSYSVFLFSDNSPLKQINQDNLITGNVVKDMCDFDFNTEPLSHPIAKIPAVYAWHPQGVIDNLETNFPDYLSILEYKSQYGNIHHMTENNKYGMALEAKKAETQVRVPIPYIIGIINAESQGGNGGGPLCNSLGYCGVMQTSMGNCEEDRNCDVALFNQGDFENQVSPGIREISNIAAYLMAFGMDPDHPDFWYFVSVGYNGGIGVLVCGRDNDCKGTMPNLMKNTMEYYGYTNINQVRWVDVLDTVQMNDQGLATSAGVFEGVLSLDGVGQVMRHNVRVAAMTEYFMEMTGCEIEIEEYTPRNLQRPRQEISEKDLETIMYTLSLTTKGYYFFTPVIDELFDYDFSEIHDELNFASTTFIEDTLDCLFYQEVCEVGTYPDSCTSFVTGETLTCTDSGNGERLHCTEDTVPNGTVIVYPHRDGGIVFLCRGWTNLPEGCKSGTNGVQYCRDDGQVLYCKYPDVTYRSCAQQVLDDNDKDNWYFDYCPSTDTPEGYNEDFMLQRMCIETGVDVYASDSDGYKKRPLNIRFAMALHPNAIKDLGEFSYDSEIDLITDPEGEGETPQTPGGSEVFSGSYWDIFNQVKADMEQQYGVSLDVTLYTDFSDPGCTDDVDSWCWVHTPTKSGCNKYGIWCRHEPLDTAADVTLNTLFRHELTHQLQHGDGGCGGQEFNGLGTQSEWGAEYNSGSTYYCYSLTGQSGTLMTAAEVTSKMLSSCSRTELENLALCKSGAYNTYSRCLKSTSGDIADYIIYRHTDSGTRC